MNNAIETVKSLQPQTASRLIEIKQVYKAFPLTEGLLEELEFTQGSWHRRHQSVNALNGVSLDIEQGEALCVVGESGCGKSTLARLVMGLLSPTSGSIHYRGERIDNLSRKQLSPYRRRMQMIFQNPYSSLNPRRTVQQTLEEPIRFHNPAMSTAEVRDKVNRVMESVAIDPDWSVRYPHEFSGGQRQRISIARALTVDPEFIVADEPVSALDVSIQAQVLNLLMDARQQRDLTYLFITHDLSVVEHFASRVAVMYLGTLCEVAETTSLYTNPCHPYTRALLSAIPRLSGDTPEFIKLKGEVPTPINLPTGCVFHNRCHYAYNRCRNESPQLVQYENGSAVACHGMQEGRISE